MIKNKSKHKKMTYTVQNLEFIPITNLEKLLNNLGPEQS